jgi:hypothetical protein
MVNLKGEQPRGWPQEQQWSGSWLGCLPWQVSSCRICEQQVALGLQWGNVLVLLSGSRDTDKFSLAGGIARCGGTAVCKGAIPAGSVA